MRPWLAACLSFVASGGLALVTVCWPRAERQGWFELDGRPKSLDRVPVHDWQHVNELLARHAIAACDALHTEHQAQAKTKAPASPFHLRELHLEYEPAGRPGVVEVVLVRQRVPARVLWSDRHPVGYATYEVVAAATLGEGR